MPYETDFDSAFTILLGKAQGTVIVSEPAPSTGTGTGGGGGTTPSATATSFIALFMFGGGGSALTVSGTDPSLVEVPDPGEIVWAHVYAGGTSGQPVAVTASINVQLTRWNTFGGSSPLYGSGTAPGVTADSISNASLSGWVTHLEDGDTLIARLASFSGTATWIALAIKVRRDVAVQAQTSVLDTAGNFVLDGSGNQVIMRN